MKLIELITTLMAMACWLQLISDPKSALRDIERGPMPNLAKFNKQLVQYRGASRSAKAEGKQLLSLPAAKR